MGVPSIPSVRSASFGKFGASVKGLAKDAAGRAKEAAQTALEVAQAAKKMSPRKMRSVSPMRLSSGLRGQAGRRLVPFLPQQPLDPVWQVGGRYLAGSGSAAVWDNSELKGAATGSLNAQEPVLLMQVRCPQDSPSAMVGFIVQSQSQVRGWVPLDESIPGSDGPTLVRRHLEGSWEMKARYCVQSAAILREGKLLNTPEVGELVPGEEVLTLALGFNDGDDGCQPRLRMQVSTDKGLIGWLSPETASGDKLLYPVNLLSPKVVELHHARSPSRNCGVGWLMFKSDSLRSIGSTICKDPATESCPLVGPRTSFRPGAALPWTAGSQYRVLDRLVLRIQPDVLSQEVGKIPAGSLVSVDKLEMVQCPKAGECPVALVHVDTGRLQGKRGWVRCAGIDGLDLLDTRDQLQFGKVMSRITTNNKGKDKEERRRCGGPASCKDCFCGVLRLRRAKQG